MNEMAKAPPKWVKPTVDYLGLIAFVGVYVAGRMFTHRSNNDDLLTASWGMAAGSAVALALGLAILRKIPPLPLFTGISAVVFAGLALIFHDTIFIKIKLTIIDGILAGALIGGQLMGKAPLKAMLGEALHLEPATWTKLTWRYAGFFAACAIGNEIIWRNAGAGHVWSEDVWVFYRFPGIMILALLFSFSQVPLMMKDMAAHEAGEETPPIPPAD
jgi:intracellular septation protein